MAAKKEKIRIEVFGPPGEPGALPADGSRADECIRRLARIIGRRMTRYQFARWQRKEAKLTALREKAREQS